MGILSLIGNTPLLELERFYAGASFRVFAKLEGFNPGGSIKDRPAVAILEDGLRSGVIGPDTVIVESSSGNMGIGLAQACRYHGLRFICVVDCKTAATNIQVLRAYGAEIDCVVEPDPVTGELLQARINRVQDILQKIENGFWPNQYANLKNSGSHYQTTMREIVAALGRIDFLFVAISTCGTIRGCGEYIRDHGLATRIVAVDAVGSLIFSDRKAKRMIPGLGAGIKPPLCDPSLIDRCVFVDDLDCLIGCRRMMAREAVLVGGSAGGVLTAVEKFRSEIPVEAICVVILPDRGERYLDTLFSDTWVSQNFGKVERIWREDEKKLSRAGQASCSAAEPAVSGLQAGMTEPSNSPKGDRRD
jgi:2,3-diaminopropionate biosynthesis protein SbnA